MAQSTFILDAQPQSDSQGSLYNIGNHCRDYSADSWQIRLVGPVHRAVGCEKGSSTEFGTGDCCRPRSQLKSTRMGPPSTLQSWCMLWHLSPLAAFSKSSVARSRSVPHNVIASHGHELQIYRLDTNAWISCADISNRRPVNYTATGLPKRALLELRVRGAKWYDTPCQ